MVVDIFWKTADGVYSEDAAMFFNSWTEVLTHVSTLQEYGAQMVSVYYDGEEIDYNIQRDYKNLLPDFQAS